MSFTAEPPSSLTGMRRMPIVVALVVWTLVIWSQRISNIWQDQDLDTSGQLSRTALAASFVGLALVVAVAGWRAGRETLVRAVAVLGLWTGAVWLVRATGILLGDHGAAFKLVHTVLAAVSVALALAAYRQVRSTGDPIQNAPVVS